MSTTPAEIWIGRGNDQLGPHAPEKIRQLVADGALRRDDLLWWDGLGEWTERDAALALLGIESVRAAPTPPPMPSRPVVRDLPRPALTVPVQPVLFFRVGGGGIANEVLQYFHVEGRRGLAALRGFGQQLRKHGLELGDVVGHRVGALCLR